MLVTRLGRRFHIQTVVGQLGVFMHQLNVSCNQLRPGPCDPDSFGRGRCVSKAFSGNQPVADIDGFVRWLVAPRSLLLRVSVRFGQVVQRVFFRDANLDQTMPLEFIEVFAINP